MQNFRRELHSSVMVRRFRKLKSCCYTIAIPSGWHPCSNPNCNARFRSKKKESFMHFLSSFCALHHMFTTQLRIEPACGGLVAEHTNHYTTQLATMQGQKDLPALNLKISYLPKLGPRLFGATISARPFSAPRFCFLLTLTQSPNPNPNPK